MKAILILDEMPKNCYECRLQDSEWDICRGLDQELYKWENGFPSNYVCDNYGKENPTWCPLITEEQYVNRLYPVLYDMVVRGILFQNELANRVSVKKVGEEE